MNNTPRTDREFDACFCTINKDNIGFRDFARSLELQLNAANAEIERLENITASGIHTCSEQCQRPMCVMRRQLRDANSKIAELEKRLEKPEA